MTREYQYLIAGGGIAANAAARGIREVDSVGSIGMISADTDPPYRRPYLSKDLWKGKALDKVWYKKGSQETELHLGRRVERIDLDANLAVDDQGEQFAFGTLLLATGVRPRQIAPATDRILSFRTLADFRHLWDLAQAGKRFAVIGSGFIGSELAAALAMNGKEVELIYPGAAIGERVYPGELASFISQRYQDEGVHLHPRTKVGALSERSDRVVVKLTDPAGSPVGSIEVDAVVAGVGSDPNDELAKAAGLEVDHGIVVERSLQTSRGNVYAAGDVAKFYQPALGKVVRIEHEDNALAMGKAAGRAMAGQGEPYDHLPFFYTDLFEMGYEAVGELDSRHQIVEDWIDPFKTGVIYYLNDGQVRGVLNWNVWEKVPTARQMIGFELPPEGAGLRGTMLAS